METGRPSTTAEGAARLRAAHQLLDRPLVLDDPIVLRLLEPAVLEALRADPEPLETPALRALRAGIALRSRYAEDCLAEAVLRGTRQYVVLGAGLDSFAYRARPTDLQVFEVDHPKTQCWKRERLQAARIDLPASLTFVPVDFEHDALPAALAAAGFDATAPAFVSWLGVTVYLTREAVLDTLAWAASLAPGSEIVFTYVVPVASLGAGSRAALGTMADHAAALGEPWRTYFEPAALAAELRRHGFRHLEDVGPEEAFARYFRGRRDGLRPGRASHLVRARM